MKFNSFTLDVLRVLALFSIIHVTRARNHDYIIVGAGSAGSIVAAKLANAGFDVLLLEAGGDNYDPAIESLYQYFNVAFNSYNYGFMQWPYKTTVQTLAGAKGAQNKTITLPRGKTLGGTHSINACAYVQANADDFNNIAKALKDEEWQWLKTQSIRSEIETAFGLVKLGENQTGAADFIATAKEVLGFPFNSDPKNGIQYGISPSYWTAAATETGGKRKSSYDTFVKPILNGAKNNGNIDVLTFHQVQHLIFDSIDRTRVIGVRAHNMRSNIASDFYASAEVIVSSGTYNSPQVLLLSGIGPQEHLKQVGIEVKVNLPGVGSNLRDHYAVATFWNLVGLPPSNPFLFQSPSLNMWGPEPQGLTTYQFELSGNFGSCVPLRQESSGTVRLQTSNPMDAPLIDPKVLSTENDVKALVVCLKDYLLPFWKGLMSKGLVSPGNIDPDSTEEQIRQFVLANVGSNHHPTGTCKVGPSNDKSAVVDKDFKVLGVKNLRVIDASVFPFTPSGNTNAATMTVAMLGANKILKSQADLIGKRLRG